MHLQVLKCSNVMYACVCIYIYLLTHANTPVATEFFVSFGYSAVVLNWIFFIHYNELSTRELKIPKLFSCVNLGKLLSCFKACFLLCQMEYLPPRVCCLRQNSMCWTQNVIEAPGTRKRRGGDPVPRGGPPLPKRCIFAEHPRRNAAFSHTFFTRALLLANFSFRVCGGRWASTPSRRQPTSQPDFSSGP